ncbi:MAG TPA: uroporphyrinogen decarboxylase family protein [Candidatus Hydrogenedentes bacterium]|nr:uroporphyrinogen decarboxylase family protein [Candidatus Hydrogenedentota bacterium]
MHWIGNDKRKADGMDFEDIGTAVAREPQATARPRGRRMTLRERFRRTMFYQEVDTLPNFEFGYWEETLRTWHDQGLPKDIKDEGAAYDYFGIEHWDMINVNSSPFAVCEHKTLEETDDYLIYQDGYGCVAKINKQGHKSIPHFISFPVKDRASWEPFKAALDPDDPRRYEHLDKSVKKLRKSPNPVGVFGGSMVGIARNLIGFEGIAIMQYEDPDLLREIIDAFGRCTVGVLERALPKIQVDFCMGWEDICFNQGPIVSPDFFRETAGPWYRRIADVLTAHGCCVYTTDTDGNLMPIVETFLDNGLNTMFPVEVHAGTDPVLLRERYGKRVRIWGGICKMKLAESKEAIDRELERLRPYVEQGAFIPGVDHRVPANVSLANYLHYLDRKREWFHVGGTPKY